MRVNTRHAVVLTAAVINVLTLRSVVAQEKPQRNGDNDLRDIKTVHIVIRENRVPEDSPSLESRLRKIVESTLKQRGLKVTRGEHEPSDAVITVDCDEKWIGATYNGGTYAGEVYAFTGLDLSASLELKTKGGTVRKSKYQARREPDHSFVRGKRSTSKYNLPADILDILVPKVNALFETQEAKDDIAVTMTGKVELRKVSILPLPPGSGEYPPVVAPHTPGSFGVNMLSVLVMECKNQDGTSIPSLSGKYIQVAGKKYDEVKKLIDKQVNISGTLKKKWNEIDVDSIEERTE